MLDILVVQSFSQGHIIVNQFPDSLFFSSVLCQGAKNGVKNELDVQIGGV